MRSRFKIEIVQISLLLMFVLFGLGCRPNDNPKDLKSNLNAYEKLIALIMKECNPKQNIQEDTLSRTIQALLDSLNINTIAYNSSDSNAFLSEGDFIRLCGKGNIFSGDSCYTYNYGEDTLEIRNNQNSGCERTHIFDRWYKDFVYFD